MSIVTFNSSYMHLCPLWFIVKVVPINDCSGLENCHSICINLFDVYYIHNHVIKWHPLLIKLNCHGTVNGPNQQEHGRAEKRKKIEKGG